MKKESQNGKKETNEFSRDSKQKNPSQKNVKTETDETIMKINPKDTGRDYLLERIAYFWKSFYGGDIIEHSFQSYREFPAG
ncbi:unnamed protein product [Arabis nemorensis]|uniref:Uncharacterized protein n=1 Tax=Arabis nemorensis TaxID=586526 RepID=A0A565CA16_9BRAS|nr:unnamed protein product [Arabis nemorensis]